MDKITKMRKFHTVLIKHNDNQITGERIARTMIKILKHKLPDSDQTIIEDFNGYKYKKINHC